MWLFAYYKFRALQLRYLLHSGSNGTLSAGLSFALLGGEGTLPRGYFYVITNSLPVSRRYASR